MLTAVKIAELLDVRSDHLDRAQVREFANHLGDLPSVVVFRTARVFFLPMATTE